MKEYDVIVSPHITEKSTAEVALGKYTFIVNTKATKVDIRYAVEKIFGVKVLSVNTLRYDGKKRSQRKNSGMVVGYTPKYKKAIVKIDTDAKANSYLITGGKTASTGKKYKNSIEEFGFVQ